MTNKACIYEYQVFNDLPDAAYLLNDYLVYLYQAQE